MENFTVDNLSCLVDLHLHLDGAITPESAKDLAKLQNIDITKDDKELENLLSVSWDCRDLNEFLEKFDFPCSLLMTKEGIIHSIINLLDEYEKQGVMYAEIRYAPQLLTSKGLTQEEVVQAAIEGINKSNIDANLIICAMRGEGNDDENKESFEIAKKYLNKGVCAVDLAGAEALFTTDKYKDLFDYARELGLPFTIHAGEADGAKSVKYALEYGASRIGHGVRSVEDEEVYKELIDKQIPLEICPTSNMITSVYDSITSSPIQKFLNDGIFVTINTDDPGIERTDLNIEYNNVISELNLSKEDVKKLLKNSVKASFANEELKAKMNKKIDDEFASL